VDVRGKHRSPKLHPRTSFPPTNSHCANDALEPANLAALQVSPQTMRLQEINASFNRLSLAVPGYSSPHILERTFFPKFFLDIALPIVTITPYLYGLFSVPAPLFDELARSSAGFFRWPMPSSCVSRDSPLRAFRHPPAFSSHFLCIPVRFRVTSSLGFARVADDATNLLAVHFSHEPNGSDRRSAALGGSGRALPDASPLFPFISPSLSTLNPLFPLARPRPAVLILGSSFFILRSSLYPVCSFLCRLRAF